MLEENLGFLYANPLLKAGGSVQMAEVFEQALMESHGLWVICSSAWLPSGGKFQRSEPLLLQLLPRVSHLPTRHSSEECGSLHLTASSWPLAGGCSCLPPNLPYSRLNQPSSPSPSARTCSCIFHLCLSTAVCQSLVMGLPKYTIHLKLIKLFLSPSSPL